MANPLAQAQVSAPAVSQAAMPLAVVAVVDENPPTQCLPPPPGPLRKPRRRNHHELYDKIARIESLLSQHGVHPEPETGPGPGKDRDPRFCPQSHTVEMEGVRESAETRPPRAQVAKGQLVQTWNGGLEFRDSKAMAVVFEDTQFHTISALIDVEFDQATWLPAVEAPQNGRRSLDSNGSSSASQPPVCVPSAHTINVLWDVFLDRVDPVTKIIHAPTFRMRVVEAANNFTNTPLATLALLFSVFLTASGSLSEHEHWEKLSLCKSDAVAEYTLGLKRALTEMNYLKNHNLDVLRSLALYSLFQQTRYGLHDPWVLNGVVVNIAYRMRLHLDGSHANLSPFECEMRRRLWWQIVILELRSGGAFGTGSHLLPSGRDTRIPLNVNDEDLIPAMIVEPRPRDGPTEMSFCIMTYEAKKHVLALPRLLSIDDVLWSQMPSPTHPYGSSSTERSETINLLQTFMEEEQRTMGPLEDRLCPDPATNPLHAMARWGREALSRIAQLIVTPMEEASEWGTEVHGPDDNFFRINLAANEEALLARQAAGRRFAWHADIDFRMQTFYYLGAQLRTRVAGSLADRVWAVMERTYALRGELWELKDKENMTLANLLLAAWERRVAYFAGEGVVLPEPPFLTRLRDEVMTIKAEALGIF
ncbi:Fungal specific transcription factor [Colletotrichum higginsianum IMI 349063]|uniref:Fungal specific transcription factor n=1 Tax=Colletotrichum higginsianum (strain IMI 349063) TaxID=759273 RepID=A0A1B7YMC0_COLHI|nr:Fungal specific transcription factor [Colletotrichum higginsianum IMI 349063]OBR13195.1 Fungal specific transcription factor [Colletotrichum higginsianum IMI 349063]